MLLFYGLDKGLTMIVFHIYVQCAIECLFADPPIQKPILSQNKNSNETSKTNPKPIEFVQTKRKSWKIIVSANRAHDTQWHGANISSNSFIICCTFFGFRFGITSFYIGIISFLAWQRRKKTSDIRIIQCNCIVLLGILLQLRIDIDVSIYFLKLSRNYHFVHAIHFSYFVLYIFLWLRNWSKVEQKIKRTQSNDEKTTEIIWCGARLRVNHLNRNWIVLHFSLRAFHIALANGKWSIANSIPLNGLHFAHESYACTNCSLKYEPLFYASESNCRIIIIK